MPIRLKSVTISLLVIWVICLPAYAQTNCPQDFVGYLPPRLAVGETARVTLGGDPNRLRQAPSREGAFIGQADPGTALTVLAGPSCADALIWWQVSTGALTGWTAEGLAPDDYFLEPVGDTAISRGATAVALATDSPLATAQALSAATGTTLAQITPSATPTSSPTATITPTPTLTPTFPPIMPLADQRTVLDASTIADLTTLAVLPGTAGSILFTPDSRQMLLDGNRAFTLPALQVATTFAGFDLALGVILAASPDMRWMVYSTPDNQVMLYDSLEKVSLPFPPDMPHGSTLIISAGPAYKMAVAVGEGYGNPEIPQIFIYDLVEKRLLQQLDNPVGFSADIAFNRNGSLIAATGDQIRLIETVRNRWLVPTEDSSNGAIAYRPVPADNVEQVAYGVTSGVVLADLGRGTTRTFTITGGTTAGWLVFSPNGALLAAYGVELEGDPYAPPARFNLFDAETGELLLDTGEYARTFQFSPDGTLLVVATAGDTTRILGIP